MSPEMETELILLKRKNVYQLILKKADVTMPGQWLTQVKISPEMCAFNGKYFVYHYLHLREHRAYTVLSQAPYFTAIMIWSECGKWTGGGNFLPNDTLFISPFSHRSLI